MSNDKKIKVGDVVAGDVILYNSSGLVSRAIRWFDGADVNHSSLVLQDGSVAEAISGGLQQRSWERSVRGANHVLVRRLSATPPMGPVLSRGDYYLDIGARYAYEQLILLAILSATRKAKVNRWKRYLLRKVLGLAATIIKRLTGGKEPLICSEFVYRCYDEAIPGSPDDYSLEIAGRGLTPFSNLTLSRLDSDSPLAAALVAGRRPDAIISPTGGFAADPLASADLNTLIQGYLDAPEDLAATEPLDPEVWDAMVDCGEAWRRSASREPPIFDIGSISSGDAFGALGFLGRVNSNFLSPGDLHKTSSLQTIGRIDI